MMIQQGTSRATITPELGGAISALQLDGRPVPLAPAFWIDDFAVTGWQTMFPNAGDPSDGMPAHGRAFHGPWRVLDSTRLEFVEDRLVLSRTVELGRSSVTARDRISTTGSREQYFLYGQHLVFEATLTDLVTIGGRVRTVADLLGDSDEVVESLVAGSASLEGAGGTVAIRWDAALMPFVWVWVRRSGDDVVLGLEPVSVLRTDGIAAAVRGGMASVVHPREEVETFVTLAFSQSIDLGWPT